MSLDKKDIEKRLENIIQHLKSPDVSFQAIAINAYDELNCTEDLTTDQKQEIIPFIIENFKDPSSPLRTDCFKTACHIGSKEFQVIIGIYLEMFLELEKKDRFRTKIIMDMIYDLRNSSNPLIQDSIKNIIRNTPQWFDESSLRSIIENFWKESTNSGFQFVLNYEKDIRSVIDQYPAFFTVLKDILYQKLKDCEENRKKIEIQRKREEKLREERIKQREELEQKKSELRKEKEKERDRMKKQLQDLVKNISNQDNKVTTSTSKESSKEEIISLNPIDNQDFDGEPAVQENSGEINQKFPTFTNLGLKRKNISKWQDEGKKCKQCGSKIRDNDQEICEQCGKSIINSVKFANGMNFKKSVKKNNEGMVSPKQNEPKVKTQDLKSKKIKKTIQKINKDIDLRNILEQFEKKIRATIKKVLTTEDKDWWDCISPTIQEPTIKNLERQKKNDERRGEPNKEYDRIDFLDFSVYKEIIIAKKNWKIFHKIFPDKNQIVEYFNELSINRNPAAHSREVDFETKIICKKYIERILSLIDKSEIGE